MYIKIIAEKLSNLYLKYMKFISLIFLQFAIVGGAYLYLYFDIFFSTVARL